MLTGRPLHGGKTDVETYREVLLDEPAPADRVNRAVSPDLAAICLTCLAKRPLSWACCSAENWLNSETSWFARRKF